jgi:hypothetical protein
MRAVGRWARLARFDPGLVQLRAAVLTMAATLASYGSALALEHAERLGLGVVVLAVVLSLTLSRTYHARDRREWVVGLAVLSLLALTADEVGSLLVRHADIGDALFVIAISGSIWIRRFGPNFARAGTLVALPFVALLIAPAVPGSAHEHLLWGAVVGAIAYLWVSVTRAVGERTGFVAAPVARHHAAAATRASSGTRRLPASSRMALQMGVSLALAFAVGRWLFGVHWTWLVMTAFIVCSGNRGRADVVYKSLLRISGAAAGTVAATLLAGAFAPGDTTTVVVIFVALGLASWLRSLSYAYWAAGITSVLALLYGYFGASGVGVLGQRLEGILVGALIAVVVSWALVPVRTTDVLRRRLADVLAALGEVLAALSSERAELALHERRFEHALAALEEIAKPLEAHRLLTRRRGERAHVADAIDAARRFEAPVRSIVTYAADDPAALATPAVIDHRSHVASKLTAARRALAGRSAEGDAPERQHVSNAQDGPSSPLDGALAELDSALASLATSYPAADHRSALRARTG